MLIARNKCLERGQLAELATGAHVDEQKKTVEKQDIIINHSFASIQQADAQSKNKKMILQHKNMIALFKDPPRSIQQFLD